MSVRDKTARSSSNRRRRELLDACTRARAAKRTAKAIGLYRSLLEITPEDSTSRAHLAQLLVKKKQDAQAAREFQTAIAGYEKTGRESQALATALTYTKLLPADADGWLIAVRLHEAHERTGDVLDLLIDARFALFHANQYEGALRVLQVLRTYPASVFAVRADIVHCLVRLQRFGEAQEMLLSLEDSVTTPGRRKLYRHLRRKIRRRAS
ncbi:MAG: tetratricopeptide repeat protein [Myxococcota bacterium]